ncbi:hypothetical protein FB107DRAFT_252761 [Schizophyllum commune]
MNQRSLAMQARREGSVRGRGTSGPGNFRLVPFKNMNPVDLLPRGRTSHLRILDSIDYTRKACRCAASAAAATPPTPTASVSLDVVSRRLCQPPRRVLDMVAVPAGLQNAKSTSIVPRSAPVPLGDRCDTGIWWAGGEERRGAPLRYTFLGHGAGGILANRRQLR